MTTRDKAAIQTLRAMVAYLGEAIDAAETTAWERPLTDAERQAVGKAALDIERVADRLLPA